MYEEALKLDPTLVHARYNLGTLCYNEGDNEAAISHFNTFIARAGENSRAHRNIGKALMRMDKLNDAVASFMKAQKLDANDPTVYYNLGIVYNLMNNTTASFDNFRKALKLYPKYTEARYTFAKALLFHDQVAAAQMEFMTVIGQSPDHVRALNGLATCFLKQNDYASAAAFLRQALDIAPEFAYAHYNLGIALRNLGFEYEANHHFKEAAHFDQTGQLTSQASAATRSARITRSASPASGGMSYMIPRQIAA
jgi:tetratricopeptide (TPR) repeat protein